jgi:hypothetical protein
MRGVTSPLPQYAFMAWYLITKKHMDNFTFTFTFNISNDDITLVAGSVPLNNTY